MAEKSGGPGSEPERPPLVCVQPTESGPGPLGFSPLPAPSRMDTQNATPKPNSENTAAGSPNYGEFGHAPQANGAVAAPGRSGANDNPDEFSEFADRDKEAAKAPDNPEDQPGHVEQNQNPAAVREAQGKDDDTQRAAWAADAPRYAGGGTHNTREEPADAKYPDTDK